MKPLSFFFDHIDQRILRGTTEIKVTVANYNKLFDMQDKAYTFEAIPKIHVASESVCESCEG